MRKTEDMAGQVLRGRSWEGTFESVRGDSSRVLIRALAVPLRRPGGDIDGMVILAREASRHDKQGEQDRLALLERVGERLAGSLEIGTTLKHVAEILVPQFADHCFIDLFQGEALVRRAQRHASDWVPAARHLGPGGRADPLPGRSLLPAGDGAPRHHRGQRPGQRVLPGAEPGEHDGRARGGADISDRGAAVRPG